MKTFRRIKICFEDIWQKLCVCKWRAIICGGVALVAVVLGAVFVNIFQYSWWYSNRCEYALKLFEGGFGLFFSFLLWTAAFGAGILLCGLLPKTKYLSCVVLFVACFYCAANTAAAILCWSVWGVLFAVLVSFVEIASYFLSCFLTCCVPSCNRTFKEALCDSQDALFVLAVGFIVKILCFFVILRFLTAVI